MKFRSRQRRLGIYGALISACLLCLLPAHAASRGLADECTVDLATDKIQVDALTARVAVGRVRGPLLEEMGHIVDKVPSGSKKPIADLLGPKDLIRFTEIRGRLLFTSAQSYLSSESARDAEAIRILWYIAEDRLNGRTTPYNRNSNESILKSLLMALSVETEGQSVIITAPVNLITCNIELAISVKESAWISATKRQIPAVDSAMAWVNALVPKHPEMRGEMDVGKLTPRERRHYDTLIRDTIKPQVAFQQAVKDAEVLKLMLRLSTERAADGERDLTESGGDGEAVGRTFDGKPRGPLDRVLLGALSYIREKIPSDAVLEAQSIGRGSP